MVRVQRVRQPAGHERSAGETSIAAARYGVLMSDEIEGQLDLFDLVEDDASTPPAAVKPAQTRIAAKDHPAAAPEPVAPPTEVAAAASEPQEPDPEPDGESPAPQPRAASTAADGHALIVLADQVITPSGRRVLGELNSISRLKSLIDWSCEHLTWLGTAPQIWIPSYAVLEALGWEVDSNDPRFAAAKNELEGRE
jgi:hypothetical protein